MVDVDASILPMDSQAINRPVWFEGCIHQMNRVNYTRRCLVMVMKSP